MKLRTHTVVSVAAEQSALHETQIMVYIMLSPRLAVYAMVPKSGQPCLADGMDFLSAGEASARVAQLCDRTAAGIGALIHKAVGRWEAGQFTDDRWTEVSGLKYVRIDAAGCA